MNEFLFLFSLHLFQGIRLFNALPLFVQVVVPVLLKYISSFTMC